MVIADAGDVPRLLALVHYQLAWRALIVEGDTHALGQNQLAGVDRGIAGQHPQQRGLPGTVAPGQGHPVPALELERDAPQERLAGHVLTQV